VRSILPAVLLLVAFFLSGAFAGELQVFEGCTFETAEWADGDSFPVKFPDGSRKTIRLYGADTFEWHVTRDSDATRLRAQRRYFGIVDMAKAKDMGRLAGEATERLLAKPFTVHTTFADGRGDPEFKRYYGFVTTAEGKDLATELVRLGLARAYGVWRSAPGGASRDEYRARLEDLELQAAKTGVGAWALTDWARLPEERQLQRDEEAEIERAKGKVIASESDAIDPNTASRDELIRLPGIGEAMALRIIEKRPFANTDDLLRVPGIGKKTLERMRPFLQ